MRGALKATGGVLAAALALAVVDSCSAGGSSQDGTMVCAPGQQINCGCPGGTQGTQTCSTDGSAYGSCRCPDAGGGASGGSGASGTGGNAGAGAQPTGGGGAGPGGTGPGGSGGAGGGVGSCSGEPFPANLPDLSACSGEGSACDAGTGPGTGTCVSDHCFLNCTNNSCTDPYECVTVNGFDVCSVLTSCGSRCNLGKAALCLSPATCITITGDTYGMCLPECVSDACPYESGSTPMGCLYEAGGGWYCGFDCTSIACPGEYDCVTVGQDKRCEPKQS